MQPEHRQAEIDQQKCETNKRLGVALRDDLAALLDKYKKYGTKCVIASTVIGPLNKLRSLNMMANFLAKQSSANL